MKTNYKIPALFVGSAITVALIVASSLWAFSQMRTASEARKHSYALIIGADALLSSLKDAETGERGYLLTGDETFLVQYTAMRATISGQLKELRPHTSIEVARKHLNALAPLVDAKLADMNHVIELRRRQNTPAVVAAVRIFRQSREQARIAVGTAYLFPSLSSDGA